MHSHIICGITSDYVDEDADKDSPIATTKQRALSFIATQQIHDADRLNSWKDHIEGTLKDFATSDDLKYKLSHCSSVVASAIAALIDMNSLPMEIIKHEDIFTIFKYIQ